MIKILHSESARGGTRVYFVAGQRCLDTLQSAYTHVLSLNTVLGCAQDEHVARIESLLKQQRSQAKRTAQLYTDLAVHAGTALRKELASGSRIAVHHRDDGDHDYLATVASIADESKAHLVLVSVSTPQPLFLLQGPADRVQTLGPRIADLLGGKGGYQNGRYRGKATRCDRLSDAVALLSL